MIRSLGGFVSDVAFAFVSLVAEIRRDRTQRQYARKCYLDAEQSDGIYR